MRWPTVAVGWFVVASLASAQEPEPQKLFEAMQQKLAEAKAQKITFEAVAIDTRGVLVLKGSLILAKDNRVRLTFEGSQDGKDESKVMVVSDGKNTAMQTEVGGKVVKNSKPTGDQLHERLSDTVAKASLISAFNTVLFTESKKQAQLKPSAFKMLAKEKIDGKDAHVMQYEMQTPDKNRMSCKLWLDATTNLPLKRSLEVSRDGIPLLNVEEVYREWLLDPALAESTFALPK